MWRNLLLIALPYAAIGSFIAGHIWRYRKDKFGWTTRTSQLLERRWLAWGSPLFHFGALFVILGHAAGLVIPASWTDAIGVSEETYHVAALVMGTISGLVLCAGLVILLLRRFITSQRIRLVTRRMDYVVYALLALEIVLGMWQTVVLNAMGNGYTYRPTLGVWFRSVLFLHPDLTVVSGVPAIFIVHIAVACLIVAIWPFTRLVHVWSVPVAYLARPYVVYRRRAQAPARPAVGRWPGTAER